MSYPEKPWLAIQLKTSSICKNNHSKQRRKFSVVTRIKFLNQNTISSKTTTFLKAHETFWSDLRIYRRTENLGAKYFTTSRNKFKTNLLPEITVRIHVTIWNQNILNKIWKSNKIGQGQEKFDIYFCVFFNCYCQSLVSGTETGIIFTTFLRSYPADIDVFKTSSGRLKKVTTSYDQTRRCHDVWQKMSDLRHLGNV